MDDRGDMRVRVIAELALAVETAGDVVLEAWASWRLITEGDAGLVTAARC